MRGLTTSLVVAALAGCAVYYGQRLDERFGTADPGRYDRPAVGVSDVDFRRDVKPILDNRCVVCHGCYDAPCQLSLASYPGLTRGANQSRVYDAGRLVAAQPTRLYQDARTNADWRKSGFFPVLNERADTPEANREASVLYRLLELKRAHPLPPGAVLPADRFDFSLGRSWQCPSIESVDRFEQRFPDWGMPFGLPALAAREHETLERWIEAGAPYRPAPPPAGPYVRRVADWEAFLNGDGLKSRLMARYIYEHWFIGHLYFDDLPAREYFEIVRSRTPPGQPIDLVVTRRAYDDPGVERVYYRLRRTTDTLLAKTHMPYALNAARMARFRAWFLDAPYEVESLPSYQPESASNPFITFEQLPAEARYRFMLEDARFTIMGFIKGPVCRGQLALNVINDHFWVAFVRPGYFDSETIAAFLAKARRNLRLPAEHESTTGLFKWLFYAGYEKNYLDAKTRFIKTQLGASDPPSLGLLWDGDGENPNAALTVFRHFDSASVIHGLQGGRPQTAWVIDYPMLERIHYLLVAGYDVYGNAGHQITTRLYMDFLRMEGELNFLTFLPRAARQGVRKRWYRGVSLEHDRYFADTDDYYSGETGVEFRTNDPLNEMYGILERNYAWLQPRRYALAASGLSAASLRQMAALAALRGRSISGLPETSFLEVVDADGRRFHFTLLVNRAHSNVAELLGEAKRLLPDEDTLSVLNGFIGAYPNAFLRLNAADLPQFLASVRALKSEADYSKLLDRYGIRRTDGRFWAHSDRLLAAYRAWAPVDAGLFDYNRFENR